MLEQFAFLIEDLKRWKPDSIKNIIYVVFELGVWATISYRLRRALFLIDIPVIKFFIRIFTFLLYKLSEIFFGVAISSETEIGPGLYIGHTGAVRIHPKAKIGRNLSIGQCVTVGEKGPGHDASVPKIGDDVYVGAGAQILGGISIGNSVKIGSNAVVISDIPDNATAVGVPAQIVKIRENAAAPITGNSFV